MKFVVSNTPCFKLVQVIMNKLHLVSFSNCHLNFDCYPFNEYQYQFYVTIEVCFAYVNWIYVSCNFCVGSQKRFSIKHTNRTIHLFNKFIKQQTIADTCQKYTKFATQNTTPILHLCGINKPRLVDNWSEINPNNLK